MTERRLSIWQDVWADMQALREVRLERMGRPHLRETRAPQEVNALLRGAMASLLALTQERWTDGAEEYLLLAWEEYLRDEWASTLTPPFPLQGFLSSVVIERCWRAAEATMHEEAAS